MVIGPSLPFLDRELYGEKTNMRLRSVGKEAIQYSTEIQVLG